MLLVGPAVLLTLATYGQRFNPGAWPVVTLMGALVVRTGAQRGGSELERRYARYVGCAAVTWLSLAWQLGPYRPLLVLPLLVLTPLVVLPWAVYRRLRELPTIDWPRWRGRPRTWREGWKVARELRAAIRLQLRAAHRFGRMAARWPEVALLRQIGLPESRLVSGHWTPGGPAWLRLDLASGRTLEDVKAAMPALEVEWRLRRGTLRPKSGGLAHQVVLEFRSVADLAPPPDLVLWPGKPPKSVVEPVVLGLFGGGRRVELPLIEPKTWRLAPHLQIAGQTGWGKGSGLNCLLAETALIPEWEHWGIDKKGGLELSPWEGLWRELAIEDDEDVQLLRKAVAEMKRRWAVMRSERRRSWVPSPQRPLIMLVVDEWAALGGEAKDLLDTLLAQARASGIWIVACTQRVSAHKTGGSGQTGDPKSQLGMIVSYYQPPGDEGLSYGDGARRGGWRTDLLDRRGRALIRWPGRYDEPDPFQTYWVDDPVVAEVAARAAAARGRRPQELDAAIDADVPVVRDLPVRTLPPPAEPAATAGPSRPALHVVTADAREDPLVRLVGLLAAAPQEGVERSELIRKVGMSDSWVDQTLRMLRAGGRAVKVGRARWRGSDPAVAPVGMRSS